MAYSDSSMPIHLLPRDSAPTSVVPDPQKQSSTKSPGFDEA